MDEAIKDFLTYEMSAERSFQSSTESFLKILSSKMSNARVDGEFFCRVPITAFGEMLAEKLEPGMIKLGYAVQVTKLKRDGIEYSYLNISWVPKKVDEDDEEHQ